ncbi:MAG: histidine kinase, partial [Bacteroidota bacterium]
NIFVKDVLKANYYINKFSILMRDGLQFSRMKSISLGQEIAFLKNYLVLEEMRFAGRFRSEFVIDETIVQEQVRIPPFIFQPVIENAVKHAFKDKTTTGLLKVCFQREENGQSLRVIIEDNGVGLQATKNGAKRQGKNKSLGLTIVQNQIDLLNQQTGQTKAAFQLIDLSTLDPPRPGVRAVFVIPYKIASHD